MDEHEHHEQLIAAITEEYRDILEQSEQGIYIYLDDEHKVCNEQFAEMLGYDSAEDWASVTEDPVSVMVSEETQEALIDAFWQAHDKGKGSTVDVIWNKKNGGIQKSTVILVPICFQGHTFALHFITPR